MLDQPCHNKISLHITDEQAVKISILKNLSGRAVQRIMRAALTEYYDKHVTTINNVVTAKESLYDSLELELLQKRALRLEKREVKKERTILDRVEALEKQVSELTIRSHF